MGKDLIMFKNTKKIILALLVIYFIIITIFTLISIQQVNQLKKGPSTGLTTFLSLQIGGAYNNIILQIIQFILIPLLNSGLFIYLKNNNSFIAIQQRTGYRNFLITGILFSFIGGAIIMLLTYLLQLALITIFCAPIVFYVDPHLADMGIQYFSLNTGLELASSILLSSIGWGIFSILVFSISLFIPKNIICLLTGVLVALILIISPLVGNMQNSIWRIISFIWFLPTIIAPGQMTFNSMAPPINFIFAYFIGIALYISIALLLITSWSKRKQGGYA
ncbi:hypothetical protein EFS61_03320 [Lactobacillus hominis]|nr:hypothetical protein [Lactobacillus hominis]